MPRSTPYRLERLDRNPANRYTYGRFCHVTSFPTLRDARAYLARATSGQPAGFVYDTFRIVLDRDPSGQACPECGAVQDCCRDCTQGRNRFTEV